MTDLHNPEESLYFENPFVWANEEKTEVKLNPKYKSWSEYYKKFKSPNNTGVKVDSPDKANSFG